MGGAECGGGAGCGRGLDLHLKCKLALPTDTAEFSPDLELFDVYVCHINSPISFYIQLNGKDTSVSLPDTLVSLPDTGLMTRRNVQHSIMASSGNGLTTPIKVCLYFKLAKWNALVRECMYHQTQ